MEEARVPIPIVGGIDDNTDPLALRPPNLATSENTRVIRGGTVSKRPGWGHPPVRVFHRGSSRTGTTGSSCSTPTAAASSAETVSR